MTQGKPDSNAPVRALEGLEISLANILNIQVC